MKIPRAALPALAQAYQAGASSAELAAAYGVTEAWLRTMLSRAGVLYRPFPCQACGQPAIRYSRFRTCLRCATTLDNQRSKAVAHVAAAIRRGELPRASAQICVDCGKPAKQYDHRDYDRPLEVQPVCRSCNHRRGPAIPLQRQSESSP